LHLTNAADTIIGAQLTKTISGGERKRTAIAVEMVTDPSLLILDEPTSGLDSVKALALVKILKRQALKGMTIISTIHSPNAKQFECFDKLIIMSDGYIVY
jgi:ABC-type multidrug transport system ATPase subunit